MNSQLEYMVSDKDIENKIHCKNLKIIEYPQLEYCKNILTFLPSDLSVLVILIETKASTGHWSVLVRNGKLLTYFDSYGVIYDGELKNISAVQRRLLHEDKPYLTQLLQLARNSGFSIVYNKVKFQAYSPTINTCGRWVIVLSNALMDGLTLKQFQQMMCEKKKETGLSYDIIVCQLYNFF